MATTQTEPKKIIIDTDPGIGKYTFRFQFLIHSVPLFFFFSNFMFLWLWS